MISKEQRSGTGLLHYVRGLDGLRAIAVSAVVIFHATDTWLRGGFLGVDVFFVLSGFLITSQLLTEWRETKRINIVAFWRRRARRIFLAALYLLLVVTLTFALIVHPEEVAVFRGDALAAFAYVANWYFIFHNEPTSKPSPTRHRSFISGRSASRSSSICSGRCCSPPRSSAKRWAALLILLGAGASCLWMAVLYRPRSTPRASITAPTRMQAVC